MEEKKYTQRDFMIEFEKKKLIDLGIDIEKNDYYKNPKFHELKKCYINEQKHFVTEAWWIEENIVGQARLEKIYGKYAFGIEKELTENDLQDRALYKALADKYPEKCRSEADIRRYFNRDEHSEKHGNKLGLIARLKEWGFDIDAFPEDKKDRVKILYFLYCLEVENNMVLSQFFGNPTLENVDNGFIGNETKNGYLMAEMKHNISREINPEYIYMLNGTLLTIAQEWETQMQCVMLEVGLCNNELKLKDLERKDKFVQSAADMLCSDFESNGYYEDSLLETFLLKLSQHEYIGKERDILEISDIEIDMPEKNTIYKPERYLELDSEAISKDVVQIYIKDNRKEIAQLVFEHDKITGSEFQKFDIAASKLEGCLDMLEVNTSIWEYKDIPKLLVIAIIQEIIRLDKKEIIENKFYRYESKDQKTLNTELTNAVSAFRKNQLAWINKVMRRYNLLKGKEKEFILARRIEKNIDRIMIKIFNCNSLNGMICVHNYAKIWLDAVLVNSEEILQEFEKFKKEINKVEKDYSVIASPFWMQMFFGTIIHSDIDIQLAHSIVDEIEKGRIARVESLEVMWPIGLEDNYFHEEEEFYLITKIDISNEKITISKFEAIPKGQYRERLIANGIPI